MEAVRDRYSTVAIILHWTIAALLVANVLMGWQFEDLRGPDRRALMEVHKAVGMSILMLTLVRLAWRLANRPPPMSETMNRWERGLARLIHTLFYVLLVFLPLTGWVATSAHEKARMVDMFGLFHIPPLAYVQGMEHHARHDVHEAAETAHDVIGKAVVYLLVPLHILGVLKHQFIDRENELGRMLPWTRRRT